jgi:hypothetical protein
MSHLCATTLASQAFFILVLFLECGTHVRATPCPASVVPPGIYCPLGWNELVICPAGTTTSGVYSNPGHSVTYGTRSNDVYVWGHFLTTQGFFVQLDLPAQQVNLNHARLITCAHPALRLRCRVLSVFVPVPRQPTAHQACHKRV